MSDFNPNYHEVLEKTESIINSDVSDQEKTEAVGRLSGYALYCQVNIDYNVYQMISDKRKQYTKQLLNQYSEDKQEIISELIEEARGRSIDIFSKDQYVNNPYYREAYNEHYSPTNTPKCPTCQSTNIQKIGKLEHAASVGVFGIFSKKINKTFKCDNCGYSW